MKRRGKKAYMLTDFDESSDERIQRRCELEIDGTLTELLGLVCIAELPDLTRCRLVDGLNHIRHHIGAQTQLLTSEISGRQN